MDGHLSWRTMMKVLYATISAAAFTLYLAGAAGAVDLQDPTVVGDDLNQTTVTIIENGQSRQVILQNSEVMYDICKACTIRLENGQEVQASEFDMVETNGSSIKLIKYPRRS